MADCQNGVDEGAACERNTWRCTGEDICLPMNTVCDGFEQCYDGSDEGDHCEADCHGPLGEHCTSCIQTPNGPACICEKGYELDTQMKCSDINECELHNGGCAHLCVNEIGSFKCACFDGHYLDADGECQYGDAKDLIHDEVLYAGIDTTTNSYTVVKHVQSSEGLWREIKYPVDSLDNQILRVYQNSTEGTTFIVTMKDIQLLRPNGRQTTVIFDEPSIYIDDAVIDWKQSKMFMTCYFSNDTPGITGLIVIDLLAYTASDKLPWSFLKKFDHTRQMSGYYSTLALGENGVYYTWKNNIGYMGFDGEEDFPIVGSVESSYSLANIVFNPNTHKLYFTITDHNSLHDQRVGVCQLYYGECTFLYGEIEELNRKLEYHNPISLDIKNDVLYVVDSPAHRPRSADAKSVVFAINANSVQLLHSWQADANMTRTITVMDPSNQEFNLHGNCIRAAADDCINGICLDYQKISVCHCRNDYPSKSRETDATKCSQPKVETFGDEVRLRDINFINFYVKLYFLLYTLGSYCAVWCRY